MKTIEINSNDCSPFVNGELLKDYIDKRVTIIGRIHSESSTDCTILTVDDKLIKVVYSDRQNPFADIVQFTGMVMNTQTIQAIEYYNLAYDSQITLSALILYFTLLYF